MLVPLLLLQAAPPAAAVSDCLAAEHRQLDFWLGRWEVRDTRTGAPAGASAITAVFKGCVLQETSRASTGSRAAA